jgi:hypothetical protein
LLALGGEANQLVNIHMERGPPASSTITPAC